MALCVCVCVCVCVHQRDVKRKLWHQEWAGVKGLPSHAYSTNSNWWISHRPLSGECAPHASTTTTQAGPVCTSWHDPQGPRAARMGLTGKQVDQGALGVPCRHHRQEGKDTRTSCWQYHESSRHCSPEAAPWGRVVCCYHPEPTPPSCFCGLFRVGLGRGAAAMPAGQPVQVQIASE